MKVLIKASKVIGLPVVTLGGDDVAEVRDVVYDPSRDDNETASARLAVSRMEGLGFTLATVTRVHHLISATKHGAKSGEENDADLALLLDLDLSVLAAAPDVYRAYATAIRREYALYPDDVYKPGRMRVLEAFLARDRIYLTERLHAAWETRARQNLASEIAELAQT